MRPASVVMLQISGEYLAQVVLIDDQQPVEKLPAQGSDDPLADRVRSGRLRRAGENPDAFRGKHGVEGAGELACAVPDQELDRSRAMAEVHQEVTRRLCCPHAIRVGGNAGQVDAAGTVLDDDQGVEAPQEHGVHVDEVDGEDAAGLGGQELLPGRARAARRGVNPGGVQDLPDRGGRDRVAELDEFALHAAMSPGRIVRRDADHELPDRCCRRRPTGTAPAGVVPRAGDQPPVPGEQRRRGHREHLAPSSARDQSRQCCEP